MSASNEVRKGSKYRWIYNDNTQKLVLHEGQGYGWFTIEEALDLKISELRKQDILSLKRYFDQQYNTKT
jgi:hypothetical protein